MKKLVGVVMVLLAIALGVPMVYAQAPIKGLYFGAGASYSWEDFRDTGDLDVDNAGGFGFYGGYQLMRYLALEVNYDWHADFDLRYNGTTIGSISDLQTFMIDAKCMYPVGRFVPYIQAGVGWMWATAEVKHGGENTSDDFAWNIGLGLEHYLTPNVSLGLDHKYVVGTGDVDDLRYHQATLRLTYRF